MSGLGCGRLGLTVGAWAWLLRYISGYSCTYMATLGRGGADAAARGGADDAAAWVVVTAGSTVSGWLG